VQPADGAALLLDPHTHPHDRQIALRAEVSDASAQLTWRVDGHVVGRPVSVAEQVLWTPQLGEHSVTVDASLPSGASAQGRAHLTVR